MKHDFSDMTFTIPFRKDSEERLENILTVIKYIKKHFDTNIMVFEQDEARNFPLIEDVEYVYEHTTSYLMMRTKMLNKMAKLSKTPFIANYDTDIILKPEQYVQGLQLLRENKADGVFPYDGRFFNFIHEVRSSIIKNLSVDGITEINGFINHPQSVGGAIFWNKQKFIEGGMENENFKSWGFEDGERVQRFIKLGYRLTRIPGILYHLNHPTSANSSNTNHQAYIDNQIECNKVAAMPLDKLRQYVNSWPWRN